MHQSNQVGEQFGVGGRQHPWPRLKMCPPAPTSTADVRRRRRRGRPSVTGQPASSTTDRGCPAAPCPARSGDAASASDVRQSTPPRWRRPDPSPREASPVVDAEMGHRHATVGQRGEHPRAVRQHVAAVVGQRQVPAQESNSWMASTPASIWNTQERDGQIGQHSIRACQVDGSPNIMVLVRSLQLAGPAFDQVGRQGERRAREADQRHLSGGRRRAGRRRPALRSPLQFRAFKAITLAVVRTGLAITGPTSATMSRSTPAAREAARRCRRTGLRVHAVPPDRLQGDLTDQLRVEAGLHHGVPGPQRPVFRERAASAA